MHKFSRTMISPFLRGVPAGGGVYVSKRAPLTKCFIRHKVVFIGVVNNNRRTSLTLAGDYLRGGGGKKIISSR